LKFGEFVLVGNWGGLVESSGWNRFSYGKSIVVVQWAIVFKWYRLQYM